MRGAEIGPLAEIGFAEDEGAGLTEAARDAGIVRGGEACKRERAGGGHHAIGGANIVLDEDRDAVERAARAFGFPLGVELIGDAEHLGIELDHAVQRGAGFIDFGDAREIPVGEAARRELARPHAVLQFR